jgi:hypothetical protein
MDDVLGRAGPGSTCAGQRVANSSKYICPDERITSSPSCSFPPGKKWYSEPNGALAAATICFMPVPV